MVINQLNTILGGQREKHGAEAMGLCSDWRYPEIIALKLGHYGSKRKEKVEWTIRSGIVSIDPVTAVHEWLAVAAVRDEWVLGPESGDANYRHRRVAWRLNVFEDVDEACSFEAE
jgi:hypothetical protein